MQRFSTNTRSFILVTAFLNMTGMGIINPVYPFIVSKYAAHNSAAFAVSMLFTAYSACVFLAVPTLGALSDRFGRRPVLLISLFGSAIGYLIFGIGGSLAILFLGRIVDGITGGNIAAIYAYAADITEPRHRTQFFGAVGASAMMGYVIGPALGGLLYTITKVYEAPLFFSAFVTFANTAWGYFAMPESLPAEKREAIQVRKLNPFTQMVNALKFNHLRLIFAAIFFWVLGFAILQSNLSYLTEDTLHWQPDGTSALFFVIGLTGIVTQGGLVPNLLRRTSEARLAIVGMFIMGTGQLFIALAGATLLPVLIFMGVLCTALGNGLCTPSLNGLLSRSVSAREQGRVQGGSQAIQALARVIGPIWGGWSYSTFNQSVPYLSGMGGAWLGAFTISLALPIIQAYHAHQDSTAPVVAPASAPITALPDEP